MPGETRGHPALCALSSVSIRSRHRCREKPRPLDPRPTLSCFNPLPASMPGETQPQQIPSYSRRCTNTCAKSAPTNRQRTETICGIAEKSNLIKCIQLPRTLGLSAGLFRFAEVQPSDSDNERALQVYRALNSMMLGSRPCGFIQKIEP